MCSRIEKANNQSEEEITSAQLVQQANSNGCAWSTSLHVVPTRAVQKQLASNCSVKKNGSGPFFTARSVLKCAWLFFSFFFSTGSCSVLVCAIIASRTWPNHFCASLPRATACGHRRRRGKRTGTTRRSRQVKERSRDAHPRLSLRGFQRGGGARL